MMTRRNRTKTTTDKILLTEKMTNKTSTIKKTTKKYDHAHEHYDYE